VIPLVNVLTKSKTARAPSYRSPTSLSIAVRGRDHIQKK
jgi:hypothetical protein